MARLSRMGSVTGGAITWSDTAGMRQVSLKGKLEAIDELALISSSYAYRKAA